jgi:hypothetical protein
MKQAQSRHRDFSAVDCCSDKRKPYVSRPIEARAGTQSKFAKFAISRPWIPALRSLRSLGRDTTENIVTQYSYLA